MIGIWETVTEFYEDYLASGDPRVTSWVFMKSPFPTLFLVAVYVAFVKLIGPAWMKNKTPYDLRSTMFAYNMGLVFIYTYFIGDAFKALFRSGKNFTCRVNDLTDPNELRLVELGWWFYFIKLVEFADTVFFVLRKKFQQITTLHLVHHSIVPIAVWIGFRVEPASYNYFFPLINTIVHIAMYTYYGLSALGPSVQKYLWWKKYLTTVQMIQFVLVFVYVFSLVFVNCKVSKFIIYLYIFLAGLFLLMFCDYFRSAYLKNTNLEGRRTQVKSKEEKCSTTSQRISTNMCNQVLEPHLEKKIG